MRYQIKRNLPLINILTMILIMNLASHFFQNIFRFGNTYWISYCCWLFLIVYQLCIGIRIKRNEYILFFLVAMGAVIGGIIGVIRGYLEPEDYFKIGIYLIAVISSKIILPTFSFNINNIKLLMFVIWSVAIIALLYLLFNQGNLIIPSLQGDEYAQWGLYSFFRQRNIYAGFNFFAIMSTLFLYSLNKRKIYLISIVAFFLIIVCTGSRAALFSVLLFLTTYLFLRTKNKWMLVSVVIIALVFVISQFDLLNFLQMKFYHSTTSGVDSGMIRIMMWKAGFEKLWGNLTIITGYGVGASSVFLRKSGFTVESFHNVYMESFFEGGIIQLMFTLISLKDSLKYIFKSKQKLYKETWGAIVCAYIFYNMFESGSAIYMSNYLSVLATITIIIIPRYIYQTESQYKNQRDEIHEEKNKTVLKNFRLKCI